MARMRRWTLSLAAGLLLGGLVSARAQEAGAGDHPRLLEETAVERKERILRAMRLPEAAEEARRSGIADEDVRGVLTAVRGRSLPPEEATLVLETAAAETRAQGPIDNFGAFVRSRLDAGLRGQALAAAIHAEHAARGQGPAARPEAARQGRREAGGEDRPEAAGQGQPGAAPPEAGAPPRQKRKKKQSAPEEGE